MGVEQEIARLRERGLFASATFTPAATPHTGPAVFGGAQEFALAPAPASGGIIRITGAELRIDGATIETTVWRLHLYNVTPPSALADAAGFVSPAGDRASYLGGIDIPQVVDLGDTLWIETHALAKTIKLAGTSLFGYLTNVTTLTPQAVAHAVRLYGQGL